MLSLKEEIVPYEDGNGLVAPDVVYPGVKQGSDNGTMFTSEYYIMLHKLQQTNSTDVDAWANSIRSCMDTPGLLNRAPGDYAQDGPDNMLGVLAASKQLDYLGIAEDIRKYGLRHFGMFNNTKGPNTWGAFLWRQPQLLTATYAAVNKKPLWLYPFIWYTALVIAYAAIRDIPIGQADPRRLTWLLIQATQEWSWLCRLASKMWYMKLYKDYGMGGMKAVAAIYYEMDHPFIKYWVD